MPKAIERLLFEPIGKRSKGEGMLQYITRKKVLITELDKAQCVLPDVAKGYIMLRDAHLPDRRQTICPTSPHTKPYYR